VIVSPPQQVHGQTVAIRLGITILLLLAIVPLAIAGSDDAGKLEPVALSIAAALTILGIAFWVVVGKTVLTIHAEGIRRTTAFGVTEITWDEVEETRYRVIPVQVSGLIGGVIGLAVMAAARRAGGKGATSSLRLTVIAKDGRKILVTSNCKRAGDAIGVILAKVQPPILADAKRRVGSGDTVAFGPLSVSRDGIAWKQKERIAFAALSRASIVGQYLDLRRKGKMLSVARVRSDRVPNVLVFLELIEGLGVGAGEIHGIDPLARIQV
jgi:hypothetical protein